jgi:oxygen-independent coproporphyrinogen-3 oxidase
MTASVDALPIQTQVGNYFISNYPPYSTWTPEALPAFHQVLARPPAPGPIGLYVHVPFCRQRCHYCYFRVYPRRTRAEVDRYLDAVLQEMDLYRAAPAVAGRPFLSVYFGGGTPSYLEPDQLHRLGAGLRERGDWSQVEEFTVECEPGTVTSEKLQTLKELGVTRVSLGFQSLNDEILRRTGRDTRLGDCLRAFHQVREAGFSEVNIDLLAGLPGETEKSWRRTVDRVLSLQPDSITVYQLELTYNSSLYASQRAGRDPHLPSWPAKRHWVDLAFRLAEAAGYEVCSGYTVTRHPQWMRFVYTVELFWHGHDLLALGESAFGHVQGVHYQNADTFERYLGLLQAGQWPLRRAYCLRPEERLRREVMLQLKTGALDAAYFRRKFGVELLDHFRPQFGELQRRGLLEVEGDQLRLTRPGLLEVDWLLPQFYLPEHVGIRYT